MTATPFSPSAPRGLPFEAPPVFHLQLALILLTMLLPLVAGAATTAQLNQSIRTNRMGQLVIEAQPGTPIRVDQTRHEFWFGATLSGRVFGPNADPAEAAQFKRIFLTNFNAAVTENALKWHQMEWRRGRVDYSMVDAMLEWTTEHGIPLRGHNIFWGIPNRVPAWQKELDDATLFEVLKERAYDIGRRYRGRFAEYDLNNEMMHANYYEDRLGESITGQMVDWVRSQDPEVVLYLNDYDILTGNKLDEFVAHIKRFQDQGVRFDGIGVQGHLHGDSFDPVALQHALDTLARFELPIRITEFNFPGQHSKYYRERGAQLTEAEEQAKAQALEDYYRICFAHPAVRGILMWGFWEGACWIPVSAIYRRDWTPTPAAHAYRRLVFDEWWTQWEGRTDNRGRCIVPAFFGEHSVQIGSETRTVTLSSKQPIQTVTVNRKPDSN